MTNDNGNNGGNDFSVRMPDDKVVRYLELELFEKVRDRLVAWAKLWGVIGSIVIVIAGIFGVRGFLAIDVKSVVRNELKNYRDLTYEAVKSSLEAKGLLRH